MKHRSISTHAVLLLTLFYEALSSRGSMYHLRGWECDMRGENEDI